MCSLEYTASSWSALKSYKRHCRNKVQSILLIKTKTLKKLKKLRCWHVIKLACNHKNQINDSWKSKFLFNLELQLYCNTYSSIIRSSAKCFSTWTKPNKNVKLSWMEDFEFSSNIFRNFVKFVLIVISKEEKE